MCYWYALKVLISMRLFVHCIIDDINEVIVCVVMKKDCDDYDLDPFLFGLLELWKLFAHLKSIGWATAKAFMEVYSLNIAIGW